MSHLQQCQFVEILEHCSVHPYLEPMVHNLERCLLHFLGRYVHLIHILEPYSFGTHLGTVFSWCISYIVQLVHILEQ